MSENLHPRADELDDLTPRDFVGIMHAEDVEAVRSIAPKLDVIARDGRTPLIVADGVEYGNSFAAQPQTAALLRKLGAKEMKCPPPCAAAIEDKDPR